MVARRRASLLVWAIAEDRSATGRSGHAGVPVLCEECVDRSPNALPLSILVG